MPIQLTATHVDMVHGIVISCSFNYHYSKLSLLFGMFFFSHLDGLHRIPTLYDSEPTWMNLELEVFKGPKIRARTQKDPEMHF